MTVTRESGASVMEAEGAVASDQAPIVLDIG